MKKKLLINLHTNDFLLWGSTNQLDACNQIHLVYELTNWN